LRALYYAFIGIVSMFFLLGCSSTKHLKKDEYILYRNSLKGAPKDYYSNLTDLYKQRNNRKVLGLLPYVNLYNFGKLFHNRSRVKRKKERIIKKYDQKIKSAKSETSAAKYEAKKERKVKHKDLSLIEGNSFMRSFGEPPEIFDSSRVPTSMLSMKAYLFSKGYFKNEVFADIDTSRHLKRITVRYTIIPGRVSIIDSVKYTIEDTAISSLVNNPKTFTKIIKTNENYNEEKLITERENIYKLLKDQGYFNFQRQNIVIEIDTLREPYKVDVNIIVEKKHRVYILSLLYFNMNDQPSAKYSVKDTFLYKQVHYTYYRKTYLRRLLDYKIAIRPYDIYNQSKFQKTQRLLSSMDMYKFVNINIIENKKDSLDNTLSAFINTQPLNKFQISQEYGMSVGQALIPGPFLSFTLKTRNIFRWLEVLENVFRYSFEAQYTNTNNSEPYRAREFSAYTSLGLSQLLLPTKLREWAKEYNPKVKFYTGYNFVKRPEYRRESFKAGLTYSFSRNVYSNFYITPIDISFIDSKVDPAYNTFLNDLHTKNGSNLFLSFKPSIVTSFQFSYVYNNHDLNARKVTKYIRPSFEIGGFVPRLLASKYGSADSSRLFGKQIFQYTRLGLDIRYYIPLQKKNTFVIRFNLGYAQPLGNSSREDLYALPYEKYFFSGGNSSIRAWKPRRLGPGSYNGNSQNGYLYEQPGEILFETNYEYRLKIVGIFNWAFFVDAGNVWTIKSEKSGSQFSLPKAFNEIAVGAGMGLRLDFSFLILRLDMANKVVDPAQPNGEKLANKYGTGFFSNHGIATYNLGIGYPF
jgi:outer membrane protein insertion porin family